MTSDLLRDYARRNRLRVRNLHDGMPVPPALRSGPVPQPAYRGTEDRYDAIVGKRGYVVCEGGRLYMFVAYASARGVRQAAEHVAALGGTVVQTGDAELGANVPVEAIEQAMKIIKVSRIRPGNIQNLQSTIRQRGTEPFPVETPDDQLTLSFAQIQSGIASSYPQPSR